MSNRAVAQGTVDPSEKAEAVASHWVAEPSLATFDSSVRVRRRIRGKQSWLVCGTVKL